MLEARDVLYPQFATHNAYTAATILEVAKGDNTGFEFQRLHGMGESLFDQIVNEEKTVPSRTKEYCLSKNTNYNYYNCFIFESLPYPDSHALKRILSYKEGRRP